jgi:hypothetical protein
MHMNNKQRITEETDTYIKKKSMTNLPHVWEDQIN